MEIPPIVVAQKECVYCSNPEIQKRSIIRNELAWAFPTNIPIVPGHTLIAPLRCVEKFRDLSSQERDAIFELNDRISEALRKIFNAEGFNFAWNEGKLAGQSVQHFHLHVLPRKTGDTGITKYDPREFLYRPGSREETTEAELASIAKLIRDAL